MHEQFDERFADAVEFKFGNVLREHFADDIIERGFGDAFQSTAEKNFARADGILRGGFTMHELRHFHGQRVMRLARFRFGLMLLLQFVDLLLRQEAEVFQKADYGAIVSANPILVKAIDTGLVWIEPDYAAETLADFFARGIRNQRMRQPEGVFAQFFPTKIDARGDVTPLVAAADLQLAVVIAAKHIEIKSL